MRYICVILLRTSKLYSIFYILSMAISASKNILSTILNFVVYILFTRFLVAEVDDARIGSHSICYNNGMILPCHNHIKRQLSRIQRSMFYFRVAIIIAAEIYVTIFDVRVSSIKRTPRRRQVIQVGTQKLHRKCCEVILMKMSNKDNDESSTECFW